MEDQGSFLSNASYYPNGPALQATCVELQVQADNMGRRLRRIEQENSKLEARLREAEDELTSTRESKKGVEEELRGKVGEIETLNKEIEKTSDRNRSAEASLRLSLTRQESTVSKARMDLSAAEESVSRLTDELAQRDAVIERLKRSQAEASENMSQRSSTKESQERTIASFSARLAEQREIYQRMQKEADEAHSQAVRYLEQRQGILEDQLSHEKQTLARKECEWSALRGEYEQAIEEVEKEKDNDVENARRDATSHVSTELEELKQQVSTLDEENRRLRSERDAAVQKRVEDVGKCQHEWAQVYADLEKLYFKAKTDLERQSESLKRSEGELARAREAMSDFEAQRRNYDENVAFLRQRLDSERTGNTPGPGTGKRTTAALSAQKNATFTTPFRQGPHLPSVDSNNTPHRGAGFENFGANLVSKGTRLQYSPIGGGDDVSPGRDKGDLSVRML